MFCLFVVIGSMLALGAVLDFADAVLFLLPLFSITGLYLLAPVVKEEVAAFRAARHSGDVVQMAPAERRATTRT